MKLPSIKITTEQNSIKKHIFFDGKELPGVVSAYVNIQVNEVPTVILEFETPNVECNLDDVRVIVVKKPDDAEGGDAS